MAQMAHKGPPKPLFTSLYDGMQQLVDAIIGRLNPEALRMRCHIRRVYSENGGWRLSIEMNGDERFDSVILAAPAHVAGELLDPVDHELACNLLGITYSSSVTVTLGYYKEQLAKLPPGFGFLVPRSEGRRMLACTFVHNKFPHRAPQNKGILRCFLGGARDEAVLNLSDDDILEIVQHELRDIMKLTRASHVLARLPLARSHGAVRAGTHCPRRRHRKARCRNSRPGSGRQRLPWHRRAGLHSRRHASRKQGGPDHQRRTSLRRQATNFAVAKSC